MAMKIELTDQQEQEIQHGRPVAVVDAKTERSYVLIAPEQYERMRAVLAEKPAHTGGICPNSSASNTKSASGSPTAATSGSASPRRWPNSTKSAIGEA